MEDDISSEAGKSARRTATGDKVAEGAPRPGTGGPGGAPGGGGGSGALDAKSGGGAASPATAARTLLPALKEVVAGLASQYELMKEVVAAVQARAHAPPGLMTCTAQGLVLSIVWRAGSSLPPRALPCISGQAHAVAEHPIALLWLGQNCSSRVGGAGGAL